MESGAERIVIACVTAHHVLPEVPEPLRARVVSLLDLMIDEIHAASAASGRYVLLATVGTRRARIFERHPRWSEVAGRVCLLDDDDQHRLHEAVYRFKENEPIEPLIPWLESLPGKYSAEGLLFGCTELHLFQRPLAQRPGSEALRIIDPLFSVARDLSRLV